MGIHSYRWPVLVVALLTGLGTIAAEDAAPEPIAGPFGFEADAEGWTVDTPGAPTTTWERGGPGAASDISFQIPAYEDFADTALVSPLIEGDGDAVALDWWQRMRTEEGFDFLEVAWSGDGLTWHELRSVSGESGPWPDWNAERVTFTPPAGPFQVRFRLTSDVLCSGGLVQPPLLFCERLGVGVWLDDVVLWSVSSAPPRPEGSLPVPTPDIEGRVFPEPRDAGGAAIRRGDFVLGARVLVQRYPDLVALTTVREELGDPNAVSVGGDGLAPWHPGDTGDGHDFHVATITDRSVPDAGKGYLLLTVAHGKEWCGLEAIPRIIEDLAIAAREAPDTLVRAGTGTTGETLEMPVGELLRRVKLMFVVLSPDGWGDSTSNGAGANTNRIAYGPGWVIPQDRVINNWGYSTLTQPAGGAITTYLRQVREAELGGRPFAAAMDYHGPVPTGAMLFVDQGSDAARIDRLHDVAERITQRAYQTLWRDGHEVVTPVHRQLLDAVEQARGHALRAWDEHRGEAETSKLVYLTTHWNSYGTTWEQIDYNTPNAWAWFFGAEAGLGADTFLHEIPCDVVSRPHRTDPGELFQLFVDNVRAMTDVLLVHAATRFDRDVVREHDLGGPVGYIATGDRVTDADGNPTPPPAGYPGTPFHPSIDQVGYDVANTDWFRDLRRSVTDAVVRLAPARQLWPDLATVVVADHTEADPDQLRAFAQAGGNVVLTDAALQLAPDLLPIAADAVTEHRGYVGYADLDRTHPWTDGLHEPARQTYEPTALGYPLLLERDNYWIACVVCLDGRGPETITENSAPIWSVDRAAWEAAGGTTIGTVDPPSGPKVTHEGNDTDRTVLGTAPLGAGRVVAFGAILPTPTEAFDHWFGLEPYAMTLTGQHLMLHALTWDTIVEHEPGPPN